MTRTRLLTILIALVVLAGFAPVASAHYDPGTGRWLERDPMGARPIDTRAAPVRIGQIDRNLYGYVRAKPAHRVDPWGLEDEAPGGQSEPDNEGQIVQQQGGPGQQCVDANGKPIELLFDGNSLKGGTDACSCTCPAASGVPKSSTKHEYLNSYLKKKTTTYTFDYSNQRQRERDKGPVPEGGYWIGSCQENSEDNANRHKYPFVPALDIPPWGPGHWGWGSYSWPLTPFPATDVNDEKGNPRGGFFVHGGYGVNAEWGSKGCIDLMQSDVAFHDFMESVRRANQGCCYVKIVVDYASTTATKVCSEYVHTGSAP
jgi:hypothetical protein